MPGGDHSGWLRRPRNWLCFRKMALFGKNTSRRPLPPGRWLVRGTSALPLIHETKIWHNIFHTNHLQSFLLLGRPPGGQADPPRRSSSRPQKWVCAPVMTHAGPSRRAP